MRALIGNINAFISAKLAFWVGAPLSCAVGLLFYLTTANIIEGDARTRFNDMARSAQTTINGRIKSYTDLLRGSVSLFEITPDLTHAQFLRYVERLQIDKEFPGIEAISFARHVTDAELPEFEARTRQELASTPNGYPPFHVSPPGRRASYNVLTYVEPIAGWGKRIGVDITAGGESPPHRAMRETGQIAAAATPVPFLSATNQMGLSIRIPIYRMGLPTATVEERRAAFVGSVGIGFRVQKLVAGVLEQMPVRGVRLSLTDIGVQPDSSHPLAAAPQRMLFDSIATVSMPSPPMARPGRATFVTMLPLGYNTRVWEAHFSVRKADLYTWFDAYAPWLAMLGGFVSTMLLYILFHTLSASRRNALALAQRMTKKLRTSRASLQLSNKNLRRLGAHAEHIKEEERRRIAREIHDDLGQNLLALRIEADMLSSRTQRDHPRLHARASATVIQIDATIKSVRQIINDLRPNVLDLGLNAAVTWQVAQFRRRTGIACNLAESHEDIAVDDRCATALFRILQESLSNISRHAQASSVQVVLQVEHDRISMSVADNGIGLDPNGRHKPGSFGLVGIEERITILGGTFSIHSIPRAGTTIRVAVPIQEASITTLKAADSNDRSTDATENLSAVRVVSEVPACQEDKA